MVENQAEELISATPAAQSAKHGPKVVLNKQKILTDIYNKEKLDAMCLCETHQTWYIPPNCSYMESNKLEVNKHGTTVITRLDALDVSEKTTSLPRKSPGKTKTCG